MSEKHTPGPWHLRPNRLLKNGSLERHEIISDHGSIIALPIGGLHDQNEKFANAKLIAQAPDLVRQRDDLLEACRVYYTTTEIDKILNCSVNPKE